MNPQRHDYDSEEFYQEVYGYAFQGAKDEEIADFLEISPQHFNKMKNGTYEGWADADKVARSEKLKEVLERARRKVNFVVRGRYLKAALGGIKIKSKTTIRKKLRIDGHYTDDEEIQTTENESETSPNVAALATWLYHHDKEWRSIQRGEENNNVQRSEIGIDIERWIAKEVKGDD